jgi:tape measure domain-containing protein
VADVTKTVSVVFQAKDEASAALNNIDKALSDIGGEAKNTSSDLDSANSKLQEIGSTSTVVGGLLRTAIGAFTVTEFVRSFIEANQSVERFQLAITNLSGSRQTADEEFEFLREVSDKLGLSIRDTSGAYLGLFAAAKDTALEGAATRDIFYAVSSAMAVLGRSSADTEGALFAIQQILSKGVLSSEELRGQLGERLPGAFSIAARAVGVTTEELGKMLERGEIIATDFLPKFAQELNNTFGNQSFIDTYGGALNRLRNAWDELLVALGKSGAFDAVGSGLGTGTKLLESFAGGFEYLREVGVATFNLLSGESIETFAARLEIARQKAASVTEKLVEERGLNESLAETGRLIRQNADLADGGWFDDEFEAETNRLRDANDRAASSIVSVGDALKILGVNIKDTKDGANEFAKAFAALANNPDVRGDQILSGFEAAIKRIKDEDALSSVIEELAGAFARGQITAGDFNDALGKAQEAQLKLESASGGATSKLIDQEKQLEKTAESAQKAEEAAQKYAIEMEKIASNERIKLIEAKVQLDIAELEAGTQRIQAAFESIDNTVNSTESALSSLFELLGSARGSDYTLIRDQIDQENERRDDALQLQRELTNAQIEYLRAQTRAVDQGDALIKIEGDGLQPHLEAFMWEVLKAIQVRVNQDGLKFLLGV